MASISLAGAQLKDGSSAQTPVVVGTTNRSAGEVVFKDTSQDGKLNAADNSTPLNAKAEGILLGEADAGSLGVFAGNGATIIVAGLTQGTAYYVSSTAGDIEPEADIQTGEFITLLGVATSATELKLTIVQTGIAKP